MNISSSNQREYHNQKDIKPIPKHDTMTQNTHKTRQKVIKYNYFHQI